VISRSSGHDLTQVLCQHRLVSYTFSVATGSPPVLRRLLDSLGHPDLRLEHELPEGEAFPPGAWKVYRQGLSTRSLELSYDKGKLEARLLMCSSPDVSELALAVCERWATESGALVEPEDDDPYPPDARPERFSGDWADREFEHHAGLLAVMVDRQDPPGPLTMNGPRRQFHIDARLLGELRAAGGQAGLAYQLLERMRRVQYLDESGLYAARILSVQDKESGAVKYTVSVWGPDQAYLFPRVTYLAVDEGERSLYVPAAAAPAIAGSKHQWLDEQQCLIAATEAAEWPALVARARAHAVKPGS